VGHFGGEASNGGRRDAAGLGDRFGCVAGVQITLGDELKDRDGAPAARHRCLADQTGRNSRRQATGERSRRLQNEGFTGIVAREEPVIRRSWGLDHQPGGVGVAAEVIDIDVVGLEQFVDQREDKKPIRPWPDPDPLVGYRRIAGPHRVYRDEFGASATQARQPDLDRIRVMIFGDAEHHEIPGPFPIGLAKFPEAAAQCVHPGSGHVH